MNSQAHSVPLADYESRRAPRRARRREQTPLYCVGHLHDDLFSVAGYIQRMACVALQTVWVEDDGSVHSASEENTPELPFHWIVGIFNAGVPALNIVDDLRVMLRERSKDWIID